MQSQVIPNQRNAQRRQYRLFPRRRVVVPKTLPLAAPPLAIPIVKLGVLPNGVAKDGAAAANGEGLCTIPVALAVGGGPNGEAFVRGAVRPDPNA